MLIFVLLLVLEEEVVNNVFVLGGLKKFLIERLWWNINVEEVCL